MKRLQNMAWVCALVVTVIGCAEPPRFKRDVWRNYNPDHAIPATSSPYKTYVSPSQDNDSNYRKPQLPVSSFGACVSSDIKNFSCN